MVPENIVWAVYSATHSKSLALDAEKRKHPYPKDVYYKDINGKWVKVTVVFECIDAARNSYSYQDAQYLGPVFLNTKTEVERGSVFPVPEPKPCEPVVTKVVKGRSKTSSNKEIYYGGLSNKYYSYYNDRYFDTYCR